MVTDGLQNALQALKAERDRIDAAIASLERLLAGAGTKTGRKTTAKKPGRKPGKKPGRKPTRRPGAAKKTAGGGKRKNAPRGLLQKTMYAVLKAARKPMGATALRDALIKAGYPAKDPQALYTALYAVAKKHPKIKKTAAGFSAK